LSSAGNWPTAIIANTLAQVAPQHPVVKANGAAALVNLRVGANQPPIELLTVPGFCLTAPAWSPTGEWIACGTANGPILVSPDGKQKRKLAPISGAAAIAWSKDGRTLYGLSRNNGRLLLMAENIASDAVRQVADYGPEWEPFGGRLVGDISPSLTPDGKSLTVGLATTQQHLWILEGFDK
jgi:hypothetical protein